MGKITNTILFTGGLLSGYYFGGELVPNSTKTNNYEIKQRQETHYIESKKHNTMHELYEINKETYAGDLEHLIQGVMDLTKKEQMRGMKGDQYE